MRYPKVLEWADSPEQIFHRSFSLGAPATSLVTSFETHRPGFPFPFPFNLQERMHHFTIVGFVTLSLNGSEAGVDLVLIQTSILLLCKSSCCYAKCWHSAGHLHEKSWEVCTKAALCATDREEDRWGEVKVNSSLTCTHGQVTKHTTLKWPI